MEDLKAQNSIFKTLAGHRTVTIASGGRGENILFRAYLDSDVSLSTTASFGSIDFIPGGNLALMATNILFNSPPQLSMRRGYLYSGTSPVDTSLKCLLKCTSDFDLEIRQPLSKLYRICVPIQTDRPVSTFFDEKADEYNRKASNTTGKEKAGYATLGFLAEAANNAINLFEAVPGVKEKLQDIYFLELPDMIKNPIDVYIGAKSTTESPIILRDYLIKTLTITLGPLVLSPGLPETVTVDLQLTAARTTSEKTFEIFGGPLPTTKL